MKRDKEKGGMVPAQRTLAEHEKRWDDIVLDWEKEKPWKMFFKVTELVSKFNRGAVRNGFNRIRLTEGQPTFYLQGFFYTLPTS